MDFKFRIILPVYLFVKHIFIVQQIDLDFGSKLYLREARGRVVSALDCEAEGRWFESHSGQWLENSLCSPSS